MTASALRPGRARRSQRSAPPAQQPVAGRPLLLSGALAAAAVAGVGLAVLTVPAAAGWIAAPHARSGLTGVLRTVAALWLVAHHVEVTVKGAGRIGMLPLGLVLLPGVLLWQAGRWVARFRSITGLGQAAVAAMAIAAPYAGLAGLLAVAARSPAVTPSVPQALLAGWAVGVVAGGMGAARALAPWARLGGYLPPRLRSVLAGAAGSLAVLVAAAAILAALSFAAHVRQYAAMNATLAPGWVGSALLLAAEVGYLPNAIVWAVSFTLGSGFAVGAGTVVTPTGSALGAMPHFPLLAALPAGSHPALPGWQAAGILAVPYLAGAAGGVLCARVAPTPALEAAPLWGACCGAVTGAVLGVLALFAGGPLGDGRMSAIGPSPWQMSALGALEVGVAAAVTAGVANWRLVRGGGPPANRHGAAAAKPEVPRKNIIYLNRWATERKAARSGRGPSALP